jgi:hypothetical protein
MSSYKCFVTILEFFQILYGEKFVSLTLASNAFSFEAHEQMNCPKHEVGVLEFYFIFVCFSLFWEFTNCEHLDVKSQFVVQFDVYNLVSKEYVKKRYEKNIDY